MHKQQSIKDRNMFIQQNVKKKPTEGNEPFKEFRMFPGDNEDVF